MYPLLTMEKQFNMLLNDYRDNYIQYKTNGNDRYKSSYESAQSAIEDILAKIKTQPAKTEDTSDLEMKLINENDNVVSAELRHPSLSFSQQYSYRTQYIIIGSLLGVSTLLLLLPK